MFRNYRRAEKRSDTQIQRSSSYFLIVHHGVFYKPKVEDLESQIHYILSQHEKPVNAGVLTTAPRRQWCEYRTMLESCKFYFRGTHRGFWTKILFRIFDEKFSFILGFLTKV